MVNKNYNFKTIRMFRSLWIISSVILWLFFYSQALDFTTDNTVGYIKEMFFTPDGSSHLIKKESIRVNWWDGSITLSWDLNIIKWKISDWTIVWADIADSTLTTNKLSDKAVTNIKVWNWAISTNKIIDWEVTGAKIWQEQVIQWKLNKTQEYKFQKIIDFNEPSKYVDPSGSSYVNAINVEYWKLDRWIINNKVFVWTNVWWSEAITVQWDIIATDRVCHWTYCLWDKPKEIWAMEDWKWCVVSGWKINCNKAWISYNWVSWTWWTCSNPPLNVTPSNNNIESLVLVTLWINKINGTSYVDWATITVNNIKGTLRLRAAHHDWWLDSFHSNLRLLLNWNQIAYRGDDSSTFIPRVIDVNVNPWDVLKWQHAGKNLIWHSYFRYDWVFWDYQFVEKIKTRSVVCKNNSWETVSDSFCTWTKPNSSESCGFNNAWFIWNRWACDKSCDWWTQTRTVVCKNNLQQNVDDSNCNWTKPTTSQSCNTQSCCTPNVGKVCSGWHVYQVDSCWNNWAKIETCKNWCSTYWWWPAKEWWAEPHCISSCNTDWATRYICTDHWWTFYAKSAWSNFYTWASSDADCKAKCQLAGSTCCNNRVSSPNNSVSNCWWSLSSRWYSKWSWDHRDKSVNCSK